MRTPRSTPSLLVALVLSFGLSGCATEIGDRVRNAAQRGAEDAAVREAYDRSRRAVTGAIECVAGDRACAERAAQDGRDVVLVDADGTPLPAGQQPASVGSADANIDFTPGAQTLYANGFSRDNVGDFPRSLHYLSGMMEVVDVRGRRMIRATGGGVFQVRLPQRLPESFTIEFDVQTANQASVSVFTAPPTRDDDNRPHYLYDGAYVNVGSWRGSGVWAERGPRSVKPIERDVVLPVGVTVDGDYVKVYVGRDRVANVPRADLGRHDAVTFAISSRADRELYLGNLRVAAGG